VPFLLCQPIEAFDGTALATRFVSSGEVPRVGDSMIIENDGCKEEHRVTHVCRNVFSSPPPTAVWLETLMDPDGEGVEGLAASYLELNWEVKEFEKNALRRLRRDEIDAGIAPRNIFLIREDEDEAEIVTDEAESAGFLQRYQCVPDEVDGEVSRVSDEARKRIINRCLHQMTRSGRLKELAAAPLYVRVIVQMKGRKPFTMIETKARVPLVGESMQIDGDRYRVVDVIHTSPTFGYLAEVVAERIEPPKAKRPAAEPAAASN
jgi:hypothetical protein